MDEPPYFYRGKMTLSKDTRLRYVSAKKPIEIVNYLKSLNIRVQIYGQPIWDGKRWYLWFVHLIIFKAILRL